MANTPTEEGDSRREFLKKAALFASAGAVAGTLAASIQRAFAIEPTAGTSFFDAEHVVILMQENRSFDHVYGCLQGVRGFNDPRAVSLPDGNPVWLQTDEAGNTYGPFRLNLKNSKATWMGELPHGRQDQGQARNNGKHDRWLIAKKAENKEYAGLPLTLGYYCREDVPFYYGLADAFTVCDQAFCSVIGPTIPNRLHLWTGTVRPDKSASSKAHVQNEDTDFGAEVGWKTFPERLEEHGISWKNYQNELAVPSGLEGDYDAWLSNFADNPLEFFTQYRVYFSASHRRYLAETERGLTAEVATLETLALKLDDAQSKRLVQARLDLVKIRGDLATWSEENFSKLTAAEQSLHMKAFVTNRGRSDYRDLATLTYQQDGVERQMKVPRGDPLHQLRDDVRTGCLPTVSWIIPPERFSDHPSSPWYGAWYLSETLDILTQNPDIWKKTIFILCYDENDGYFDHIPPFVPPRSDRGGTGKVSAGIDTSYEHVREDLQKDIEDDGPGRGGRDGPIGLGYRVPLVIASPWSRGGYVCSEVFDHTSVLQFLEIFLSKKTGQTIRETNISDWRRAICGDLSSVFRPFTGEKTEMPASLERNSFLAQINQAQFRPIPNDYAKLSPFMLERARRGGNISSIIPEQERGVRPSCALPYELAVEGALSEDRRFFKIRFEAASRNFGGRSAGAPFRVYSPTRMRSSRIGEDPFELGRTWDYAVAAGKAVSDLWSLGDFQSEAYLLRVCGPNGFFREFGGNAHDPMLAVTLQASRSGKQVTGDAELHLSNQGDHPLRLSLQDLSYGGPDQTIDLSPSGSDACRLRIQISLTRSLRWYDLGLSAIGYAAFTRRYAGRVETGRDGFSDPFMGRVKV